jgi:hypothetical protein
MSPKSSTNIYSGLEGSGYMAWLFVPMTGVSVGLVAIGVLLRAMANRRHRATRMKSGPRE